MKKCSFCAEEIQDDAILCRFCNRDQPSPIGADENAGDHAARAKTKSANSGMVMLGLAALAIIVLVVASELDESQVDEQSGVMITLAKGDSPQIPLRRCGTPTSDTSSADEIPRPPMVTRMLTYANERVRLIYVNGAGFGNPPTNEWRFVAASDSVTNSGMDPAEAASRLQPRCQ